MLALKQRVVEIEYPKVWVPVLRNVVLGVQSADIRTVEALCVALAQDNTDAGRVLEKLFEFFPRSIRVDGAIWKADAYWWTDHRINYRKMVRARKSLSPVVVSWKQKAQGAPTWHYQLDAEALLVGVARSLECSTAYARMLILQNQNRENAEIPPKMVKSAKSITLDSDSDSNTDSKNTDSKTVTEIEFALIGEGLHAKTAAEFAGMNPQTVRRVIETVREMDAAGKIRKNKAAVLVTALRRELTPPPSPLPLQGEGEQEQEQYMGSEMGAVTTRENPVDVLEAQVDARYRAIWSGAKEQLRLQLDATTFNTWLADVRVIGVENPHPLTPSPFHGEGESTQTVFVLAVRNERALDMCRGRLHKSVRNLVRICSGFEAEVRFETPPLAPLPQGLPSGALTRGGE